MGRSRSCGRWRAMRCAVPSRVDGVADFDPPRADRGPAPEAAQSRRRNGSASPGPTSAGSPTGPGGAWPMARRWPSPAASMTIRAIVPALRAAGARRRQELVWSTMLAGITECGIPAMSLADNGMVYTGRLHAFEAAFEANLRALGTHTINSTPSHPQTCGKIERFWQTLKKWLRARPARGDRGRTQRHCWTSSATSTTTTVRTGRYAEPPRRGLHRHRKARPADRPAARTGLRQPPHRRREVRQRVRPALQGQRRTALGRTPMRQHPRRRPHRHLQRQPPSSGNSPPTPAATTSSATRPREPTAHANPNPHHECQRCPET